MGHQRTSGPHRCLWRLYAICLSLLVAIYSYALLLLYRDLRDHIPR
jgi:hypothetical protein